MSETPISHPEQKPENSETLREKILMEINQTPPEHWSTLLRMIQLFRETVTLKSIPSQDTGLSHSEPIDLVKQDETINNLLQSWVEEGDEEEQTETGEYLRQIFDKSSRESAVL